MTRYDDATCADCPAPATHDAYAGWLRIGNRWVLQTRPLCDWCGLEDAQARAEAVAS